MSRTTFLVDGFNLYHSLREAQLALGGQTTRWLDLRGLCASYLPHIDRRATLESVYYFSALAHHLERSKPGVTRRHESYIRCLRASGVIVEMSKFKRKDIACRNCRVLLVRYEEKETDVAIAVRLLELFAQGACETAVIVSGDSDIVPAIRCARRLYPTNKLFACFPFNRQSLELRTLCHGAFQVTKEAYRRHQFPQPFRTSDGTIVPMPPGW